MIGYHIAGADGDIGHVEDFLVDDETWSIRYMVVDTRNWWFGTRVLVSSDWITSVDWNASVLHVDLTRERSRTAQSTIHQVPCNATTRRDCTITTAGRAIGNPGGAGRH